jgi:hypothetical protein
MRDLIHPRDYVLKRRTGWGWTPAPNTPQARGWAPPPNAETG